MISVIMAVWNGARFMDRAIASVVAQTSPAWELIIVDDGSEDDSPERARRWQTLVNTHLGEEKIRVFSTTRRSGPNAARNLAAAVARHVFFAYIDCDDLWFPQRIESLVPFLEQFDVVFAPYLIFEKGRRGAYNLYTLWGKNSYVCSSEGDREPPFDAWLRASTQKVNVSVPLGVAHRRCVFEGAGGFQTDIVVGADGVLWRRMADQGASIGFCPVVAGIYHVRSDSHARTHRLFSPASFELDRKHPSGSNGQYLDADWFAALEKGRQAEQG
jgi:glycosyltransferase involved in cell wall biosynthesis